MKQLKEWTARYILLIAIDLCFAVFVFYVLSVGFASPAYAYVDPSVLTYTIQALAGVAVAISAVAGVAWRRLRRRAVKKLGIDENAHKTVEPRVRRTSDAGEQREVEYALQVIERKQQEKRRRKEVSFCRASWWKRFFAALLASSFLSFTVFILSPFETVVASIESLLFGLSDVVTPMVVLFVCVALSLALLVSFTKGRVYSALLAGVFAVGLACYCQLMFLNTGLPEAAGLEIDWSFFAAISYISLMVWLVIIVGMVVFSQIKQRLSSMVSLAGSAALLVVQGVAVASLFLAASSYVPTVASEDCMVTEEGLFTVSGNNNVIMFVLDTFDTTFMEEILETYPDTLDSFTDFTYFNNTTGSYIPTRYAMAYLLSGEKLQDNESFSSYLNTCNARGTFIPSILEQNYSVGIYSDSVYAGLSTLSQQTINIKTERDVDISSEGVAKSLTTCSLYRVMPWVCKPAFVFTTDEVNSNCIDQSKTKDSDKTLYLIDDSAYYEKLKTNKISIADDGYEGSFRCIHLAGAHAPYTLNENAESCSSEETDQVRQAKGSLKIVEEYITQLKQLGLYENATIIVTADHGQWGPTDNPLDRPSVPLMLIKPATNAGNDCVTSTAPVSHFDLPATVLQGVGSTRLADRMTVWNIEESDQTRNRYYYDDIVDTTTDEYLEIIEYLIVGDSKNVNNWSATGKTWEIDE